MINQNFTRSITVFAIALSTPILIWILLKHLADSNPSGFDPSPRIQSYVENPHALPPFQADGWWHVVNVDEELVLKTLNGGTAPLSAFDTSSSTPVFVIEAQGPTMAKKFHAFLKEHDLLGTALVLSASDGLLKDLRFHDPNLSLGAGQAYVIRVRTLQQLGLENLLTINMSGALLDPKLFQSSLQVLTDYFTSRRVPVFIGPVTREEIPALPKNANFLFSN